MKNFIYFAIEKPVFIGINNSEDLYYYFMGAYAASIVYKRDNDIFRNLEKFSDYLNKKHNLSIYKNWGSINDFHSIDFKESLEKSKLLFQLCDVDINLYSVDINLALLREELIKNNINNFHQLIILLKIIHQNITICTIKDFDLFYMGYLIYGDYEKKEMFFAKLKDKSFIYLNTPGNNFNKYVSQELEISPIRDYRKMIEYYCLPQKNQVLDMFFKLVLKYYESNN